jgi:3'-phosphoadenosine 5'-phosphosulfate sulfotransferase (PAPS reductase)/FAD synthetase
MFDFVISSSYGNDSIALIQWCIDKNLGNVAVVYMDTGWAAPFWKDRVDKGEELVLRAGFKSVYLESVGMESLIRKKKAWPSRLMQFCTEKLKMEPFHEFLASVDKDKDSIVMVGVRREESTARANWPEFLEESNKAAGRSVWSPLVNYTASERDELIKKAGFEVLTHRSQECYPCVNANKADLLMLDEERVQKIEDLEESLGFTSKGKPRTMFRPHKKMGAIGIREIIKWAHSPRGKYQAPELGGGGCDSGFCETADGLKLFDV